MDKKKNILYIVLPIVAAIIVLSAFAVSGNITKKADEKKNVTFEIKLNELKPPIKKGEVVGQIIVKENDTTSRIEDVTVSKDVEKANIINLFLRHLNNILVGNIDF